MKSEALLLARHILMVDDNESDTHLFILAHRRNQSSVIVSVARDGVEALEILRDVKKPLPQLVLLDINMPKMGGFEVLETLRADERTRLLPVVIFSSSIEKSDKDKAGQLGANGMIQKPAGFLLLCEVLAQIEHDWLTDACPERPAM